MTRVLIAEDEPSFRELLDSALRTHGYDTRAAGSGREAIEVGVRFRPDVLVTDWMLSHRYHGLHVAETLRLVRPDLQTILVTGFGSRDVGFDATQVRVFDLLHKPFDFGRLLQSLENATRVLRPTVDVPPFAVLQVDHALRIVHRNPLLESLLDGTPEPVTLDSLLAPGQVPNLESARHEWQESRLRSGRRVLVRSRAWEREPGFLLALLPRISVAEVSSTYYDKDFLLRALFDLGPPGRREPGADRAEPGRPTLGRALVVDGATGFRRRLVRRIEQAGVLCHSADELRAAQRLLEHDPGIRLVVLDGDLLRGGASRDELARWVAATRDRHPHAVLLAYAATDRSRELREVGLERCVRRARLWAEVKRHLERSTEPSPDFILPARPPSPSSPG